MGERLRLCSEGSRRAVQRSITCIALERGNSLVFGGVVHNDDARESNPDVWINPERGFMLFDPDNSVVERDAVPSVPLDIGTGFCGDHPSTSRIVDSRDIRSLWRCYPVLAKASIIRRHGDTATRRHGDADHAFLKLCQPTIGLLLCARKRTGLSRNMRCEVSPSQWAATGKGRSRTIATGSNPAAAAAVVCFGLSSPCLPSMSRSSFSTPISIPTGDS
ncbi:hypothetical protein SAMN05414139_06637 [Burkholderia sp. D7]|nr:hypothetical protein SAMN05414139_06637 [Burkholderia sp. D7]